MEGGAARGLPPGLKALLQDYTKAVLRECGTPCNPDAAAAAAAATSEQQQPPTPPALWDAGALYRFSSEYFQAKAAERRAVKGLLIADIGTVHKLSRALGVAAAAAQEAEAEAEERRATGFPEMPLGLVASAAEEVGLSEEVIDRVVQLTLRAGGWGADDEDGVTGSTPVNAVHFVALCVALVPSKTLYDTARSVVAVLRCSALLVHAFACFAALDPGHAPQFHSLVAHLAAHPATYDSAAMLQETYPELACLGKPTVPGTASAAPSRPGTASTPVVVSHSQHADAADAVHAAVSEGSGACRDPAAGRSQRNILDLRATVGPGPSAF